MIFKRFKTHLHVLQLEGYSPSRFLRWWRKNVFVNQIGQKTPLVYTWKAQTLQNLSVLSLGFLMASTWVIFHNPIVLLVLIVLWWLTPFLYLFVALLILKPYEVFNRWRTVQKTRKAVLSYPDLVVIGVTGSFGKTTTKDFLAEILSAYALTLKTPQSFNTVFGIAKVVKLELTSKIKYFICEMGAYVRGEIKELTVEVPPRYAILTAIGTQHLERFKTIQNTTLAKFELVDAVIPQNALVNLDNPYIAQHIKMPQYQGVQTYSLEQKSADFYVTKFRFTDQGIDFVLRHKNRSFSFATQLFGTSSLQNLIAAISMAFMLGVPDQTIREVVKQLKPSSHRVELKKTGKAILIDDAYSSNEQGFKLIMEDLSKVKGKKILITPGIVELGEKTRQVHEEIGQKAAQVFDQIYLVGRSERTLAMESAIKAQDKSAKVFFLEQPSQLWPTINKLSGEYDWILLENDLPDNY